ncbi:hypothetical protein FACS189474_5430 [Bacteroidia bacterium]|nr:hypothetical protein FACS189474_5430 [Bacteroidia bacterium]
MKTLESANLKSVSEEDLMNEINEWWGSTDFKEMELITRYRQIAFNPKDGYQSFVDACDKYWRMLTADEKIEMWNLYK